MVPRCHRNVGLLSLVFICKVNTTIDNKLQKLIKYLGRAGMEPGVLWLEGSYLINFASHAVPISKFIRGPRLMKGDNQVTNLVNKSGNIFF